MHYCYGRFQWPSGLRRGSVVARFLGLRVRIPPTALMSSLEDCVSSGRRSAMGRSLVQRSPTD